MNPPDNFWMLVHEAIGSITDAAHKAQDTHLTKREQIAAMAMQGGLTLLDDAGSRCIMGLAKKEGVTTEQLIARIAVGYADALLAELAKGGAA